jgi:type 1 fimbria pilin
MSTTIRFQRLAVFGIISTCSSLAFAVGGTIRFSGAVVESACTVQNQVIDMKTLAASRTGSKIPLSVYCNASQSVQISMQDMGTATGRKTFDGGVVGAEVAISHGAALIGPGDSINYNFKGKQAVSIPLTATLRKAANVDAAAMHSTVLVSFDYR